jgi:hypothetical protein
MNPTTPQQADKPSDQPRIAVAGVSVRQMNVTGRNSHWKGFAFTANRLRVVLLLLVLGQTGSLFAANWFVRPTATGSANGSDWNNAWTVSTINWASVNGGDTIWLAGGTYSSEMHPTKGGSAGNFIYVKRVRASDSVPVAAAGWSGTFDSQVVINSGGTALWFDTPGIAYIYFDGRVDMGLQLVCGNSSGDQASCNITRAANNLTFSNIDFTGPGSSLSGVSVGNNPVIMNGDHVGLRSFPYNGATSTFEYVDNLYVSHCRVRGHPNEFWWHHTRNSVVEYCKIYDNGAQNSVTYHGNVFINAGTTNITFSYNEIFNWQVEGIFYLFDSCSYWYIYGNLFHDGMGGANGNTHRILEPQSNPHGPIFFYNNTVVNCWSDIRPPNSSGTWTAGSLSKNNLFYNISSGYNGGGIASANILVGSSTNIFVNYAAQDYHIVATTGAGYARNNAQVIADVAGQTLALDPVGKLRGADGVWDIGAFEYGTFSLYSVGNSLTQDLIGGFQYCATTYETALGNAFNYGSVFRSSTSLPFFYNVPGDTTTASYEGTNTSLISKSYPNNVPWTGALPVKNWDVVTLQLYPGAIDLGGLTNANQGTDLAAINSFITDAHSSGNNVSTRFYIYAVWPQIRTFGDTNDYGVLWRATVANSPSQGSTRCRSYFTNVFNAVKVTNPNIGMIPVGEVLYELDIKMKAGLVPGFSTVQQLYRDSTHFNNLGRDIAGFTAYATIFDQSPVGLSNSPNIGTGVYTAPYTDPSPAAVAPALQIIQQTVWEVVTNQMAILGYGGTIPVVTNAPFITLQPLNQSVVAGQTATFTVSANGTLPLSYQWFKNSSAIGGATSTSYTTPVTTTNDTGSVFSVVVSNFVNTVTSSNAVLTVTPASTNSTANIIFQVDFNGAGAGTGGTNNIVTLGGTAAQGGPVAGFGTNSILNTSPFVAGSGQYQEISYAGGVGNYTSASFTPNSDASWNALIGPPITNGIVHYLNLNGAFDIFARPVSVPTLFGYNGFRPVDVGFTVPGTGIRFILNGTGASGSGLVFALTSRNGSALGANTFTAAPVANQTSFATTGTTGVGTGGNGSGILANPFVVGQVEHVGFTLKTDPNSGQITLKVFAQAGAGAINTANTTVGIGGLVYLQTFYGNGDYLTNTAVNWQQFANVGTGNASTWNYDSFRMYNGDPGTFGALTARPGFNAATANGGQFTLNWTNAGTLLWATNLQGPWLTNDSATSSPYSEPILPNQNRFFRLQQ